MWKRFCRALTGAVLLMVSLGLTYPNFVYAMPQLSDGNAKNIIAEGINKEYIAYVPTGDIKIAIIADEANPKNKLFAKKGLDSLKILGKTGILSIKEKKGNCEIGRECYVVDITEKGKKVNIGKNDLGFYLFRLAEIKISKIVKNTEYKHIAKPNEDFRLVLCISDFNETELGKEFYAIKGEKMRKQYKQKVLLKYDPFKEKYLYVTRDWGYLEKDGFETNKID